jgi:hypothetical protein
MYKMGISLSFFFFHFFSFPQSNEIDGSSIQGSVRVLLRVATCLLKQFRDMLEICSEGIKYKLSGIEKFHKLMHIYFSKAHATTLSTITQHSVLQNQPLVKNLHYGSLSKTLVREILHQTLFQEIE